MAAPYTLSFEAFSLTVDGSRVRIASGVREYSTADIRTERTAHDGSTFWNKTLSLPSGFIVGVILDSTPDVEHLAIFGDMEPGHQGFSFEDFAEQGGVFTHHELGGQLKVSFRARPSPDHLEAIEFRTNVTLRYIEAKTNQLADGHTHEIVVQQGSVFCLQP